MARKKRTAGKKKIRIADPQSDGLAKKMLGHFIPYEIGMMRALHGQLQAGSPSKLDHNAKIESFHIHARNLMEFFKDDIQCAIDPRTFTTNDYRIEGDFIPRTLESKISQQIVHLTHERSDVIGDKLSDHERDGTFAAIEKQIERFEKSLRPEWQCTWQEGLRTMNFVEVFSYVAAGPTGGAGPPRIEIPHNNVAGPTNEPRMLSGGITPSNDTESK